MEIIFHVGMGKTGSSSIQSALKFSREELEVQKAHYLGMWFDFLSKDFQGLAGERLFYAQDATTIKSYAAEIFSIMEHISKERLVNTFIFSNESLFKQIPHWAPLLNELRALCKVRAIAYVREPRQWLVSAFSQWSVFHKGYPGPVKNLSDYGPFLMGQYEALRKWHLEAPGVLELRAFDVSIDVVNDFSEVTGLTLSPLKRRSQKRADDAELLLRALYNNRIQAPALPSVFNRSVLGGGAAEVVSVSDMIERCFNYDAIESIILEKDDLFAFINDSFGIDLISNPLKGDAQDGSFDEITLRNRLNDYLVEVVLRQADRISALEASVNDLLKRE